MPTDALPPIPTNTLAPPEVLPNLTFANPTSPLLTTPTTPVVAPSITVNGTLALTLSETHLTSATDGINGTVPNLALTSATGNFGSYFTDTAGSAPITSVAYALSITGVRPPAILARLVRMFFSDAPNEPNPRRQTNPILGADRTRACAFRSPWCSSVRRAAGAPAESFPGHEARAASLRLMTTMP